LEEGFGSKSWTHQSARTGLDFYKDQFMFILGHKVNFAMAAAKVTFQDVMNPRIECGGVQRDNEPCCTPET
jgi:hypothetical protein